MMTTGKPPDHTPKARSADTTKPARPDRRKKEKVRPNGTVRFDAKGNPIWEVRVDTPRRRENDDTFDLIKSLDIESLSLSDEEPEEETGNRGYNPYSRGRKK
jgi:hypothetical protein